MAPLCGKCNTNPFKYKCPTCNLPYCSVACYKLHRSEDCNALPTTEEKPPLRTKPPQSPQSPPASSFSSLFPTSAPPNPPPGGRPTPLETSSPELQRLFQQYPTLQPQLREIYAVASGSGDDDDDGRISEEEEEEEIAAAAAAAAVAPHAHHHHHHHRGPRGGRGGRRTGQRNDHRASRPAPPWSPQKGFQLGVRQIQKLRAMEGAEGEGLRQFIELINRQKKEAVVASGDEKQKSM